MSSVPLGPVILVVDDEEVVVAVVRRALENSGYRVITAATGPEAVEACKSSSDIAVAVLDYGLRGISGPGLFASIRQSNPHARILITSGFLPKPFTAKILLSAVFSEVLAYEAHAVTRAKHSS
jgi:CheY-like chemotaxis protein